MSAPGDAPSWPLKPDFAGDLFKGAAPYYLRYRPGYPPEFVDALLADADLTRTERLLDLGCGTGQVAVAMAARFDDVVAVDQEPEMVDVGWADARQRGITNVSWRVGRAEDVDEPSASFDLVVSGNAFHRLDRPAVAHLAMHWLVPGGVIAVMGDAGFTSATDGWGALVTQIARRHGARPGGPSGDEPSPSPRATHEEVLVAAGFDDVHERSFPVVHEWTPDEVVGYLYSTSIAATIPRAARAEFEAEVRQALRECDPTGPHRHTDTLFYLLGRRPPA